MYHRRPACTPGGASCPGGRIPPDRALAKEYRMAGATCRISLLPAVTLILSLLLPHGDAWGAPERLSFDELYSGMGVLGLTYSPKVERLHGQRVRMRGFMAPPLKAEASFFVLTSEPVSLCPFCQSDADWPDDILVVYLSSSQEFVQNNTIIAVEGRLDTGTFVDPETGFLSRMRLMDARYDIIEED